MTYCLGMLLDEGLVMMADSRTNAGVDNFSSYRKLHCLVDRADRKIYAAAAGNLSITQTVISLLREGLPAEEDGPLARTLEGATSMFRAAQLVGEALQIANKAVGSALDSIGLTGSASLLLGGRIAKGPPALFMIYQSGNFIECKSDVPFLQIGETKYGRPILDRALSFETPLAEAVKIGFLSFDSTMKSNLGVAHPIDVLVLPADRKSPSHKRRIGKDDDYFRQITRRWAEMLNEAVLTLPDPPWLVDGGA